MKTFQRLGLSQTTVVSEGWFEILAQRKREVRYGPNPSHPRRLVAIYGSSTTKPGSRRWQSAYRLGRELAKRRAVIINGGYGGIMEASALGARSAGGHTIGVTCDNLPEKAANAGIAEEWKVERWDQRLLALVWLSDAYAVCPGSSGTLVELAMVVETQLKGFIPPRPIVCLGNYWSSVVRRIGDAHGLVKFAANSADAADLLMK